MRRPLTSTLLSVWVVGCHQRHPLDVVPIVGATHTQEAAVRAELDHIVSSMEVSDVRLASVRFGDLPDGWLGRYRNHRVVLAPGLQGDTLRTMVRHEVCHAMEFQQGHPTRARDGMDAVASWWEQHAGAWYTSDREKAIRGEGFALICEQGVHGARALWQPCQGLDPEVREEIAWAVDVMALEPEPEVPTDILVEDLDVGELGPWEGVVNSADEVVLTGEDATLVVEPDGTLGPGTGGASRPQPTEEWALFGMEPLVGWDVTAMKSASGQLAAVATPRAANHPAMFLRDADGRWAQRGCALGDAMVHWNESAEVVMAWAPDDEDVVRIEVLP